MAYLMKFGEVVKVLREKMGSQRKLADAMGRSVSWVQKTEASDVPRMHLDNYIKLAEVFGLTRDQLDAMWKNPSEKPKISPATLKRLGAIAVELSEFNFELVLRDQSGRVHRIPSSTSAPTDQPR
jgi:transcriptional regulator with XRE-family HTH domain